MNDYASRAWRLEGDRSRAFEPRRRSWSSLSPSSANVTEEMNAFSG